ncbi:unnamed protein product [Rhodiola kirilowii]
MPRKTPRRKKQVQVSDEDTPDNQRNLRKVQNEARQLRAQNHNFTAFRMNHNPALLNGLVEDNQQRPTQQPARRTLGDYTAPRVSGFQSAVAPPDVDNNNWEIRTGLIQMLQNNQFTGRPNEDPHQHLKRFVQMLIVVNFSIR